MEEKLIEAVRNRKLLFDTSDPDYSKTKLKYRVWEEVAQEIGMIKGAEAKLRWEKLRHSFRDAVRRQSRLVISGVRANDIRQWKHQKRMSFLLHYMATNKRRGGRPTDEDSGSSNFEFFENLKFNRREEAVMEKESVEQENVDSDLPTPAPDTNNRKEESVKLLKLKTIKKEGRAWSEERVGESEEKICPERDPLYHFFLAMYEMTRVMPPSAQINVRNAVYNSVSQMDASLLSIPHLADDHYRAQSSS